MSYKIDYWYFNDYFNKSQITELNKFIQHNHDKKEPEYLKSHGAIKTSEVLQIQYHKLKDKLNLLVQEAYGRGLREFGYDLSPANDLENLNLNIYSSKNKSQYECHYDSSNSDMYDVKLTLLINVSLKKYEGGKFEYLNNKWIEVKELEKPGNVVILKSYFHHRVTPVTSGERRTLTHFMVGPRFI